jgi:hypothetical protein
MEIPSIRYILTRIIYVILLLLAAKYAFLFYKTQSRKHAIASELQTITTDSSFFRQFYVEDARRNLVRAMGLILEADSLGMGPDKAIDRVLGVKEELFESYEKNNEPSAREKIIRNSLRGNHDNLLKLGYTNDIQTFTEFQKGVLPPIPSGPQQGRKPHISYLIPPTLSPGLEKVIANLVIRPPQDEPRKPTDIELAAAKQLANELSQAGVIEEPVRDRIIKGLSQ